MYFVAHYIQTEKNQKIEVLHHPDGDVMKFETIADAESGAKEILNVDCGNEKIGIISIVNFSVHEIPE
jgi:hypothetical protein